MTSWMECGCGGDVILHENPGEERYGRQWRMILSGNCKQCGRFHETVPFDQRHLFEKAKSEYEEQREQELRDIERSIGEEEKARLAKLTPAELLKELGPDDYPWFHLFVHFDGDGEVWSHHLALTLEAAEKLASNLYGVSRDYRVERGHKILKTGRVEATA